MNIIKTTLLTAALICPVSVHLHAQDTATADSEPAPIVIEPLFEYPVAPDSLGTLQEKSTWVAERFWDGLAIGNRQSVDQNALNHAMGVFVELTRWSDSDAIVKTIDNLLQSLVANPTLSLQFTKAAEEKLYGPRAQYWSDELYLKFIDNLLKTKKIKKERTLRYRRHADLLRNSMTGGKPAEFDYTLPSGTTAHYRPDGVLTVIEFGDPDCDDCRFAKLKMETDVEFSELVDRGQVNVLFIITNKNEGWEEKLSGFPTKWHTGANEEIDDLMDLRSTPSIYVIDEEGKIAAKNIPVTTAMSIIKAKVTEKEKI